MSYIGCGVAAKEEDGCLRLYLVDNPKMTIYVGVPSAKKLKEELEEYIEKTKTSHTQKDRAG